MLRNLGGFNFSRNHTSQSDVWRGPVGAVQGSPKKLGRKSWA